MNPLPVRASRLAITLLLGIFAGGCQSNGAKPATSAKPVAKQTDAPVMQAKAPAPAAPAGPMTVYVGTYTHPKNGSKGIYKLWFDPKTGQLGTPEVAAETKNPSFLAISPDKKYVYAVGELAEVDGQKGGAVTSFAIGDNGKLTQVSQISSGGAGPCYVSVDATGRNVFAANYSGGSVSRSVSGDGGKLTGPMAVIEFDAPTGPAKPRQDKSHAHMISADPKNEFVLATDLGTDLVMIYRLDVLKGLIPTDPPTASLKPGSGPRHFAFHPSGKLVFVINELSNTITSFGYDAMEGTLKELDTLSTLPADFKAQNTTAQVLVHPGGKYVYGSNRGHDSIAAFSLDEATGKLTPIGHTPSGGKQPRNFNIDPAGNYLIAANQGSDSLVVFKIDPATGKLTPTGQTVAVGAPVCVQFLAK
jgi:6-phosphogluconolactonase